MKFKIISVIILAPSFILFSDATVSLQATSKYVNPWGKIDETPATYKVDQVLSAYVPGYGWFPGVQSLIGEPVKDIASFVEGFVHVARGELGAYAKLANVIGRYLGAVAQQQQDISAFEKVAKKRDTMINPELSTQNYIRSSVPLPLENARISKPVNDAQIMKNSASTVVSTIYSLWNTSAVFNEEYAYNLYVGKSQVEALTWAVKAAALHLGAQAFQNWIKGLIRRSMTMFTNSLLQRAYYIKGNEAYNKKIDIVFKQNPILFTLDSDRDRQLLVITKMAEFVDPNLLQDIQRFANKDL